MTLDSCLLDLMGDTITIEPFVSETAARVATYGTAVTYNAQVQPWLGHDLVGADGKAFRPAAKATIAGRVSINPRDRITLPSDMLVSGTRTPPIRIIQPAPTNNLGLDTTEVIF